MAGARIRFCIFSLRHLSWLASLLLKQLPLHSQQLIHSGSCTPDLLASMHAATATPCVSLNQLQARLLAPPSPAPRVILRVSRRALQLCRRDGVAVQ